MNTHDFTSCDWVFFDLDGTLADSIPAMRAAYDDFLESFSYSGTATEFNTLNGPSLVEIIQILKKKYGLLGEEADLLEQYYAAIHRHLHAPGALKAMPEAMELLFGLKTAGKKLMLTTSSPTAMAQTFLDSQGWAAIFDGMVCGDEVAQSKPHPEIYQLAIARSGAHTPVVVEDSLNGVRSAAGADLPVIAVSTNDPKPFLDAGATTVATNLAEVMPLFLGQKAFLHIAKGDVATRVLPTPRVLTEMQQQGVAECWADAEKDGRLFDGDVFCLQNILVEDGKTTILGAFEKYSRILAQYRKPELGLDMKPLGVSAVCILTDGHVVMARRGEVTQYPGCWEFPPSGSIDKENTNDDGDLNILAQILAEYAEETGASEKGIVRIVPLGLVRDEHDRVYDVCFALELGLSPAGFEATVRDNWEYADWQILPMKDAEAHLLADAEVVPTSIAIVEMLKDAYSEQF